MTSPRAWIDRRVRSWLFTPARGTLSRTVRAALIPIVPLYKAVRFAHQQWRRRHRIDLPRTVVSVGNLSMGGTGKTGFVIWLIEKLRGRGLRPAVLKRGEGDRGGVVPTRAPSTQLARSFGDESALIRHHYPELPIGVGSNRHERGKELLRNHSIDVFVLDDGFQHRQLHRDLDLVLLGGEFELEAWEIPAGPLREPVGSLNRADFVSLKTTPFNPSPLDWKSSRGFDLPSARRLRHGYRLSAVTVDGRDVTGECREHPVDVITTLGRPDDLVDFLREEGISVNNHVVLPDHDRIDFDTLRRGLKERPVLVTEKEWIKLPARHRRKVGLIRSTFQVHPSEEMVDAIERRVNPG